MANEASNRFVEVYQKTGGEGANVEAFKPGINANLTNLQAGGATTDSALADAGYVAFELDGVAYAISLFTIA